jgi:hypothetical protein
MPDFHAPSISEFHPLIVKSRTRQETQGGASEIQGVAIGNPKPCHRKPKTLPLGLYVVAFQAEEQNQNTWKMASICGPFTPVYRC